MTEEDRLQCAVAELLDLLFKDEWCHVANERHLTDRKTKGGATVPAAARGQLMKRKGVKKGVPDVLVFRRADSRAGLAIELKVGKAKPSDEQTRWLDYLYNQGWYTCVCRSMDDVRFVIRYVYGV